MRIGLVSTLSTSVRKRGSGSVESLVWLLSREFSALGHDVTVFAAEGSKVCGELVATLPGPYGQSGAPDDWQACEWINLCEAVSVSGRFDVLHSHAYLWSLPLEQLSAAPMVHTTHVMPWGDAAALWNTRPDACVTAISRYQWHAYPERRPAAVIHHGLDESEFTFRPEPEDYVCYIGRFTPGKGPLDAIAAARALGVRIVLAGPRNDYFATRIAPCVDGTLVDYVGPVGGPQRDALLGGARALLYPNREPEPFGLVLAEAMSCGTPVVAAGVGAVPEIVAEGVTGCIVPPNGEFSVALERAIALDRPRIHTMARTQFSALRMARQYLAVYRTIADGSRLDGTDMACPDATSDREGAA